MYKLYEEIFQFSNDAIFVHKLDAAVENMKFIAVNNAAIKQLGYTREELLNMSPADIDYVAFDNTEEIVFNLLTKGSFIFEAINIAKDGTLIESEVNSRLYISENGDKIVISISRDIRERKIYEKKINESEKKYRLLIENLNEGIWYIDKDSYTTFVNPRMAEILGYTIEEMLGKHLFYFMDEKGKELALTNIERRQKGIKEQHDFEFIKKNGDRVYILLETAPFFDDDGSYLGAVAGCIDYTERKKLYDELLKSKEEAEKANRAKSSFLANISHEVRTPINGITGFLSLLSFTQPTNEQREYIEAAKKSSEILLHIVNDILDISKIESGKLNLNNINFNLKELLEDTVKMFEPLVKKTVKLNFEFDKDINTNTKGDPGRLKQILNNIIGNAVKFTSAGSVNVNAKKAVSDNVNKESVLFQIIDTGIGIAEDKMDLLFKPFSQIDNSSTKEYGGTGLGLAISKELITLMNGTITVKSSLGKGSIFEFQIDFDKFEKSDCKNNVEDQEETKNIMENKKNKKILIVEDNAINIKLLSKLLTMHKYNFDVATNGNDAITACINNNYDIVLMDCQLPILDGYDATKIIRKAEGNKKHTKIFAMTAYALDGDSEKCKDAGMDGYLSKPININEFLKILQDNI